MKDEIKRYLRRQETKKRRREWYIILAAALSIILLTIIETHFSRLSGEVPLLNNIIIFTLININILLLLLLVFLAVRNVVKLLFEKRKGILGSKIRAKLVSAFVSLSIVPTIILFFISIGFLSKSMNNWFNYGT